MSQSKARPQPDWNAAEAIVKLLLLKVVPQVTDSWGELGFSSKSPVKPEVFTLLKVQNISSCYHMKLKINCCLTFFCYVYGLFLMIVRRCNTMGCRMIFNSFPFIKEQLKVSEFAWKHSLCDVQPLFKRPNQRHHHSYLKLVIFHLEQPK